MKRDANGATLVLAVCLTLVVLMLGAGSGYAQVTTGSISGSIVDAQNTAVPNVTVKAVNKATNEEYNGAGDNAGLFRLNQLATGTYRLEISKQGFKKLVFDSIDVTVAADHGLGVLKLELGEVTSTIEVTEAPPLMQSSEAQITNAFTSTAMQTFPGVLENQGLDLPGADCSWCCQQPGPGIFEYQWPGIRRQWHPRPQQRPGTRRAEQQRQFGGRPWAVRLRSRVRFR